MEYTFYTDVTNQQINRHEIARTRQFIDDLIYQHDNLDRYIHSFNFDPANREAFTQYSNALYQLNLLKTNIQENITHYNELINGVNTNFSKSLPDQCKREIYHLYHAGRYTQEALAGHYGVHQSTISKIVNGDAPLPLDGINTHALR